MKISVSKRISLLAVSGFLASLTAHADLMFVESGATNDLAAYGDIGMTFQVNTAISVTELGYFGLSLSGGDTPYVQLWNDDSDTQLGVVNWAGGEAGAGWNYKLLSSAILLTPGVNYQIQGVGYWVRRYDDDALFTYAPEIDNSSVTFKHDGGWGGWGVLPAPSASTIATAPTAVNFNFTAVPEPATALLMLSGLFGLRFFRSRKH